MTTYHAEYNPRTGYALIWRTGEDRAALIHDMKGCDWDEVGYRYMNNDTDLYLAFGQYLAYRCDDEGWNDFRPTCSYSTPSHWSDCDTITEEGSKYCPAHTYREETE